jgi:hypothetical protein
VGTCVVVIVVPFINGLLGGFEIGERCMRATEFSSQAAVESLDLAGRGRAARRSQQMLDVAIFDKGKAIGLYHPNAWPRWLCATRELATHHRPRLPGLLIAAISWCYKPTSHSYQAPGTGPDRQQ